MIRNNNASKLRASRRRGNLVTRLIQYIPAAAKVNRRLMEEVTSGKHPSSFPETLAWTGRDSNPHRVT